MITTQHTLAGSFIGGVVALLTLPHLSYGAQMVLSTSEAPAVGEPFFVTLFLDGEGESINAVEGILSYPRDSMVLKDIRDGNSSVNIWVEKPVDTDKGIRFAGIIPGGYAGNRGEIASLEFEIKKAGDIPFSLVEARALINDGLGTQVPFTVVPRLFIDADVVRPSVIASDQTAPEPFTIERNSSPDLFNGQPFAVFLSQDKQSGIERYEVGETKFFTYPRVLVRFVDFKPAQSPYELRNAKYAAVYVKAIDRAGNERLSVLSPEVPLGRAILLGLVGILIVLGLIARRYGTLISK